MITPLIPTFGTNAFINIFYKKINELVNKANTYKVYTAILNQSGTSAPVATVLENTLGFIPTWSRLNTGAYKITAPSNEFVNTFYTITRAGDPYFLIYDLDASNIGVNSFNISGVAQDQLLYNTRIEIRVYN